MFPLAFSNVLLRFHELCRLADIEGRLKCLIGATYDRHRESNLLQSLVDKELLQWHRNGKVIMTSRELTKF